jgi:threonine/homoserine/homoserine lactone efflux protein
VGTSAFLFGITIAIAIGPIALLIISVSANTGLHAGVRSAAGAAAADLMYALLAFAIGYRLAPMVKSEEGKLGLIASLVLVGFGVWMVIVAFRRLNSPPTDSTNILKRPFLQTYALTAVNPLTLILFAGFAVQLPLADSLARVFWFGGSVALGSLLVNVTLAIGGAALGRIIGQGRILVMLNVMSGLGITAFGLVGLSRWITA